MPMTSSGTELLHSTATRKAMFRLVPILCLAYFMSYVDRTNIALAKTHLQTDVGISAAAFGLGAGLFFVSYAFLEVPSNLIMYRIGPRRWIARIAVTWGLVTAAMMFVNNDITFYLGRVALGAAEAGLYPAMMFMVTRWFAQQDRARAIGFIYLAATVGILLGAPMGGALIELDSLGGLHGWQWMFLVEGLLTIIVGFVVLGVLPETPTDARWLTSAEARALTSGAVVAGAAHQHQSLKGNWKMAFGRSFIVLIGIIYLLNQITMNGVAFNVPSIIEALNVDGAFLVGLLSGITGVGGTIGVLLMPRVVKRFANESHVIAALAFGCAVVSAAFLAVPSPGVRIVLIGVLAVLMFGTLPLFWSVAMARMSGLMAAAGLAFINTVGLTGGFVGPYVFGLVEARSGTPVTGFYVVIAVSVIGAALAMALHRAVVREDARTTRAAGEQSAETDSVGKGATA